MIVYVLLVDGFEESEAIVPIDIMRRANIWVETVGVDSKTVTGAHEITVKADIGIKNVDKSMMRALVLPGGPGHIRLNAESVHDLINYAVGNSLPIGAICAAPSILGEKGLLQGKMATCFPGFESSLRGATVLPDNCVHDGNFITAKGAGAASEFGFELVAALEGWDKANKIKQQMQYL